jgi:hypothetical protein
MTYELHPLCSLFPRVTGAEFDALVADIKANGLREPIVLHNDMVLDGGNRYRACQEAGVEPHFVPYTGGNLVSFVLSANLHRRHLTPGQQAAIVASAQDWAKAQPAHRPEKAGNVAGLDRVQDRAAQSGASERTQRMADKVAKADPALAKKVAHGEVSLPKAVAEVDGKAQRPKAPPKPKAASRKAPAPAAAPAEPEDPDLAQDPAEVLEEFKRDLDRAENRARELEGLLNAEDAGKKLLQMQAMVDQAIRARDDAMHSSFRLQRRVDFLERELRTCGRAVGVTDLDQIPRAVQAFVRQHKVSA